MYPTNSPHGNPSTKLSGFHHKMPDPGILEMYFTEQKHPAIPTAHPLFKNILYNISSKIVLDLGCGMGSSFIEFLLQHGLQPDNLYSLDADEHNFAQDAYPRKNKIIGTVEKLPFPDQFFDIVHSNELTMDNLDLDYAQVLQEVARVLKKDGVYLAFEHFEESLEAAQVLQQAELEKKAKQLVSLIHDNQKSQALGLKPVIKVQYLKSPLVKEYQFLLYVFQKR